MFQRILPAVGVVGTLLCIAIYLREPSFPTPDKLLVLVLFVGLIFGQAIELFKRLAPFVLLLALYESFRGFADHLNTNVNYMFMPVVDKAMFLGELPTKALQNVLWNGQVQWYDFALYVAYMLHYVFPAVLAILIWKKRESHYWRFIATYIIVSFAGFITFVLFPAAPPWMASDMGLIEPISRVSSSVWFALGIQDFPSLYSQVSPNPVAAVPSLHAAYATLFCLFIFQLFKGRWRYITLLYPAAIYFGTVYMGEHYVIDEILGGVYAVVGFWVAVPVTRKLGQLSQRIPVLELRRKLAYAFSFVRD